MKTFEELGVCEQIRKAIEELGFVHPMPVQEAVIPYLLGNENDVIALAQTGTGKTAAFGIPLLERIDTTQRYTQALVLSPTRELCLQIADDLRDFAKYIDGLHVEAVYGGAAIEPQMRALKKGVEIIVATPGRLVDLMHRGKADLSQVTNIVLDEADEMLNMGFSDSINEIFVLGVHHIINVVNALSTLVAASYNNLLIVVQILLGYALNFLTHSGREHQRMMIF